MTAAAFEWVWEMAAIACAVMVLGAVIVAGRDDSAAAEDARGPPRRARAAAGVALLAVVAIGAVAVPMAGALATRDSRAAAADGRLDAALQDSRTAERLQPYAATPHLQRALVLEQAGALAAAAAAAQGRHGRRADELAHVVRAGAHRRARRTARIGAGSAARGHAPEPTVTLLGAP